MTDDIGQSTVTQAKPPDLPLANPDPTPVDSSATSFGQILANDSNQPTPSAPVESVDQSSVDSSVPDTTPPVTVPESSSPPSATSSDATPSASIQTDSPEVLPITPATPLSPPSPVSSSDDSSSPNITSFGDMLSDTPKSEPSINIEPIEPPVTTKPPDLSPKDKPSVATSSPPLSPPSPLSPLSSFRQKANQKRLENKQKHLDQVIALIKESQTISNSDVQRLCRVSQSTATNYLTELEKKGIIKQQGIRGGAKYIL